MKLFNSFSVGFLLISLLFLTSCDDDNEPNVDISAKYENGFLIANEGPFQSGSGTVSFFNYDSDSVTNNVFQTVNNRPLGNVLQSISLFDKEVFLVINNAGKVEVADAETFESTATIDGLQQPRYFKAVSADKAYITEWIDGYGGQISIVDLNTYQISDNVISGLGPEKMLLNGNTLYVTCSGGFSVDSTVMVINTETDEVIENITVGVNPSGIVKDEDGFIWVLCSGNYLPDFSALENSGSLYKIDPASNTVVSSLSFNDFFSQPGNLTIETDGDELFYSFSGGVYKMDTEEAELPTTPLFTGYFYGLGFDAKTTHIIASDAGDYTSNGKIIRYNSDNGNVVDEFTVGIAPNGGFFFSEE